MKSFWTSLKALAPQTASPADWSCDEAVLVEHLTADGLPISPAHLRIILSYAEGIAPDLPWQISAGTDGKFTFRRKRA